MMNDIEFILIQLPRHKRDLIRELSGKEPSSLIVDLINEYITKIATAGESESK